MFNGEGGLQRDAEAYDLWAGQGIPKDRIYEMGMKDNFWQMGDTGSVRTVQRDSLRHGCGGVGSGTH